MKLPILKLHWEKRNLPLNWLTEIKYKNINNSDESTDSSAQHVQKSRQGKIF